MTDASIFKYKDKKVVIVKADRKKCYNKTLHKVGTVISCENSGSEIGVLIDGMFNLSSSKGLFWYRKYEINLLDEYENRGDKKMEGNFKIAVVNLYDDSYQKDYGFALYDEASVGDLVVVNPRSTKCLGVVKKILTQEEYGSGVTKEVLSVVDMTDYNQRVIDREYLAKLEKEKKELQRELDKKIAKLKDLDFYERAAKELGERDPEITEMVNRLKKLTV